MIDFRMLVFVLSAIAILTQAVQAQGFSHLPPRERVEFFLASNAMILREVSRAQSLMREHLAQAREDFLSQNQGLAQRRSPEVFQGLLEVHLAKAREEFVQVLTNAIATGVWYKPLTQATNDDDGDYDDDDENDGNTREVQANDPSAAPGFISQPRLQRNPALPPLYPRTRTLKASPNGKSAAAVLALLSQQLN